MTSTSKMVWFGAGAVVSYLFCFELNKMAMQSLASNLIRVSNKSNALEARVSSLESSLSKPKSEFPDMVEMLASYLRKKWP